MKYAAHHFKLSRPLSEGSGITRREHYKVLAKRGAKVPELKPPPVSEHVLYLFEWFLELNSSRAYGASGPQPISFQELKAWAEMTHRKLHSFETKVLKRLDNLWLEIYHK